MSHLLAKRTEGRMPAIAVRPHGGTTLSVESIFEFKCPAASRDEGLRLTKNIGSDMPPLGGYLDTELPPGRQHGFVGDVLG